MPKVTVDDQDIELRNGATVLQVCGVADPGLIRHFRSELERRIDVNVREAGE